MRTPALPIVVFALLVVTAAAAQQVPIFDPDDYVTPWEGPGVLLVPRLVTGGSLNGIDDYRPLRRTIGFVHLANSVYWSRLQFSYKHTEARRAGGTATRVDVCECIQGPIYFPTPPSTDSTPAAPVPGSKETVQFAWYGAESGPPSDPVVPRYRVTMTRQRINTFATSLRTDQVTERRGHESSYGFEADIDRRIAGHLFGFVTLAHTARSGTTENRAQNELTYTNRFPILSAGPVLLRAMLTVGGVSGRGATGLNIVNPYFEAYWHHAASQANVHLVWSRQSTRSGTDGWETRNQLALFLDRALFVRLFQ